MAVWVKLIPWGFLFLLAGAVGQSVIPAQTIYPPPVCAVRGSTVTLPCTFTPLRTIYQDGRAFPVEINRVVWCQNHIICHGDTPTVYDSDKPNQNPRYSYLGDKKGNCTLQITDVQTEDNATLYFRMESSDISARSVGSGVRVTVAEPTRMRIESSMDKDRELTRGDTVSLTCKPTFTCTFHDLEVTWFKDGRALSQSGPSLQLGLLTAKHSGNYSCGLKRNDNTQSLPIRIYVEGEDEETESFSLSMNQLLAVRLLLFTLHTGLFVTVASVIIKRTCFKSSRRDMRERRTLQPTDFVEEQ